MTRTRIIAAFLASLAAGGMAGWFRPLPAMDSAPDRELQVDWRLPPGEMLERSSAALSSQARTLKWMDDGAAGPGGAAQEWTLKAILGAENAILMQSGKEPLISRADVGATLPDGSRLVALRGDTIVVELDGCHIDKPLYPRASNSDSSECKTATAQKDAQQP
ncbi:hypothetical protein [Stenotrophomonas nitritireducens]|uniref:hypothetical protein n=1 Tax=Stenotrophomonas nitritireducens TaxID=83617 RepID=UPI001379DF5E|nr:hypothetical protein [Stenotrophomonas nitritireducens]